MPSGRATRSTSASGTSDGGYLYDVVDGENGDDDPSCRPNQLFAISLDHPVLDAARWKAVLEVAAERLLTPVGLRSLAPGDPDYKPSTMAICARATPPIIRERFGPG